MSSVINDSGLLDVFVTWSGPMKKLLLDVNIKYLFSFQKVLLVCRQKSESWHIHHYRRDTSLPLDRFSQVTWMHHRPSVSGEAGEAGEAGTSDGWRVGGCWTVHTCFIPQWRVWELRVGFISDETCIFWSVWTGSEPYTVCVTKKKNRLNHFLSKNTRLLLFVTTPGECHWVHLLNCWLLSVEHFHVLLLHYFHQIPVVTIVTIVTIVTSYCTDYTLRHL